MNFSKKVLHKVHGNEKNGKGHVDICFDESGSKIATCGFDGEAKVFTGFDDSNPSAIYIGEVAYACAVKKDRLYVAGDDNCVQSYNLDDSSSEEVLLRFTAHISHICINKNANILVAGASDFMVKALNMVAKSQTDFRGHTAPVLSVAIHPNNEIIASSSCDGTVRIWQLGDAKCLKVLQLLPKSNDVELSKTLARINFSHDGKFLIIPVVDKMIVYDVQKWSASFELVPTASPLMPFSLSSFSSCGRYVAGASPDGWIFIWDFKKKEVTRREKHDKKSTLTGLSWNPASDDIVYCDDSGNMGMLCNVTEKSTNIVDKKSNSVTESLNSKSHEEKKVAASNEQTVSDLFDDEDDDALLAAGDIITDKNDGADDDAMNGEEEIVDEDDANDGGIPGVDIDGEEEDDGDLKDVGNKKKTNAILDDEDESNDWSKNLTDLPSVAGMTAAASITADAAADLLPGRSWEPAHLQKAFQPSSSPVGLSSRFMVWNDIGRVQQYSGGDDDGGERVINVEFHDSSIHHAIHVDNSCGYTMAALSTEALVLACEAEGSTSSQVMCMHFGSWDSNKEWTCSMPENEDIRALCVGDGWLALATDRRLVRIFTLGGVQKQLFSIPGPVVAIVGRLDLLAVVYHEGMGITGDQCLSYQLFSVLKKTLIGSGRLIISFKSILSWVGFSSEGTLFTVDSSGCVRVLNRGFSNTWMPVANLKDQCKGQSDNCWVVGIRENPQQIRAIFCKGCRYPPTLPLPIVQVFPFTLPLCEMTSEKSKFEEQYWRTKLFSEHFNFWRLQGYEFEESDERSMKQTMNEMLMRQFALACRLKKEVRAVEICEMMPDLRTIQLAIKYSMKSGESSVAQRLNDLASTMAAEEEKQEQDVMSQSQTFPLSSQTGFSNVASGRRFNNSEAEDDGDGVSRDDRCLSLKPAKIIATRMSSNSSSGRNFVCQTNGKGTTKTKSGLSFASSTSSQKLSQPPIFDESANLAPNDDDDDHSQIEAGSNNIDDDAGAVEPSEDDSTTNQASRSNSVLLWRPKSSEAAAAKVPSLSRSQTSKALKNPFKVLNSDSNSYLERTAQMPRGTNVFDTMEKVKSSNSRGSFSQFKNSSSSDKRHSLPAATDEKPQKKRKRNENDQEGNSKSESSEGIQKEPKKVKEDKPTNQKLTNFMFSKNPK